jgi:hypothetical protein
MRLALAFLAFAALIQGTQAQTTATVLVQDSTYYGSQYGYLSTNFIGLKLPSGGGSVSVTVTPGDFADNNYVMNFADHTSSGPYYDGGSSTSFNIGAAGTYWMYLAVWGTTSSYDWVEMRVVASTFSGTITCNYCSPPSGWTSAWPPTAYPLASGDESGVVPAIHNQPGSRNNNIFVPRWVIPVLAVVIALAVLIPVSYCVYRRRQANKQMSPAAEGETEVSPSATTVVEMQTTTSAV